MINLNQNNDPANNIVDLEQKNNFLKFCTLVCIIHNKKLNLANIFLLILQEKQIKKLYMLMCDFDTEMEALKSFFDFDSTLHKSKYIKKYLNSRTFKRTNDRARKKRL
jgi:hypothetical protein